MDEITLRIRQRNVAFTKSARYAGIEPSPKTKRFSVLPTPEATGPEWFGRFRLVDVAEGALPRAALRRWMSATGLSDTTWGRVEAVVDGARRDGAIATHVYHTSDDGVPFVPTGRIFVRLRDSANERDRESILENWHLSFEESRHGFDILHVTSASRNPMKVAAELQQVERVEIAEPDLSTPFRKFSAPVTFDALLENAWHLENRGVHGGISIWFREGADVRVRGAWERLGNRGIEAVRVAIIDDGFLTTHPALAAPRRWAAPRNFGGGRSVTSGVAPEQDPTPRTPDDTHGTECAGLIGAFGTGEDDVVGVAPQCTLIPIRWNNNPYGTSIDDWFMHAAKNDAAVVSCSWGPSAREFELPSFPLAAIRACAQRSRDGRGALIVFAAGNDRVDVSVANNGWLNPLAMIEEGVIVAGLDSRGEPWDSSNCGTSVTLCAPAGGLGDRATIATCSVLFRGDRVEPFTTRNFGGTSAACALVAGVAALTLSANPKLTARQLRDILVRTAWKPDGMSAGADGRDVFFGHGCVDASAAVAAALD